MPDYTVDLTLDWQRVGTGDGHRTFTITPEWVGPGLWQAAWPLEHTDAQAMLDSVASGVDPRRWGVALRSRGATTAAVGGFCTSVTVVDGAAQGFTPNSITAYGLTDNAVLSGALSYPDPADDSTTAIHGWLVYVDGNWLNAETAILDLIRENLGSAAVLRRRLSALTVPASLNRGGAVNYARRFPTLLDAVKTICLTNNLSVRVDRTGSGLAVVVEPQSRNNNVRWSTIAGTLAGAAVTYGSAGATSVLVGGKRTTEADELTRQFVRVDATAPAGGWAYPREVFKDDTGADTLAEMVASGQETLAELAAEPAVTVTPVVEAPFRYGLDYKVGDLTPVDVGRGPVKARSVLARVESVTITHTERGVWTTTPQIGEPLGSLLTLQRRLKADISRRGKD